MAALDPIPLPANARTVLIVVDMQVFFFRSPDRRVGLEAVTTNINRLIDFFDAAERPVFHIVTRYRPDGTDWDLKQKIWGQCELITGTPEAAMLPAIHCRPHHETLIKTRYSAFHQTGLAERLLDLGVHRVLVAGAYTHYCVNETAFDAYAYNFIPGVVTDAVISNFPIEAQFMLDRMARGGFHLLKTDDVIAGK